MFENGSNSFSISKPEWAKVINNALVFFAPVGVIYLGYVASNISQYGISLEDFVPNQAIIGAATLYVINVCLDFLRKFLPNTVQ